MSGQWLLGRPWTEQRLSRSTPWPSSSKWQPRCPTLAGLRNEPPIKALHQSGRGHWTFLALARL